MTAEQYAKLYVHILALDAKAPAVRTQLSRLLHSLPPEAQAYIGDAAAWNLFLLDVEGYHMAYMMALSVLDHLMAGKEQSTSQKVILNESEKEQST